MVLDDAGYPDVPIYAPNQAGNFFKDLGIVGNDLLRSAWQGMVAIDMLEKALLQLRPYETQPGAAEEAFWRGVEGVADAITNDGTISTALTQSVSEFKQVPIERTRQRPRIGLVGEFYIRSNSFSNQNLISKIEALGGEVWTAPVNEWHRSTNGSCTVTSAGACAPSSTASGGCGSRI